MTLKPILRAIWLYALWHGPLAARYEPTLPAWDGRIVTLPDFHLGLRPALDSASDGFGGVGVSAQVTVRTPW